MSERDLATEIDELQKRLMALELFCGECFRELSPEAKRRVVSALEYDGKRRLLETFGEDMGADFVATLDAYIGTLPWVRDG